MHVVTLYSTPDCAWCKKTREFFAKNGVAFTDVDVTGNIPKIEEMIRKSGQSGVPVIEIDGTIVIGFDVKKISALLEIAS